MILEVKYILLWFIKFVPLLLIISDINLFRNTHTEGNIPFTSIETGVPRKVIDEVFFVCVPCTFY